MSGWRSKIWVIAAVVVFAGCHRTAPQRPTQRTSEPPQADSAVINLLEVNHRMAIEADRVLMEMVDSLNRATGREFAQLPRGGWVSKRTKEDLKKYRYEDPPRFNEKWRVRIRTKRLDGTLLSDTESTYTIKKYEMPISVEDAVEEMCAGETQIVLAPWYAAYGIHGEGAVAGYENVIFEVCLHEKL